MPGMWIEIWLLFATQANQSWGFPPRCCSIITVSRTPSQAYPVAWLLSRMMRVTGGTAVVVVSFDVALVEADLA